MRRRALLVAILLVASCGAVAFAAPHPGGPRLTADRAHVQGGGAVILHGNGFPRRADIVLLAAAPHTAAKQIGTARTGVHGGFAAPIRIDIHAAPGLYVATACHDACRLTASVRFRVVSP
jgi:hypothetical protein